MIETKNSSKKNQDSKQSGQNYVNLEEECKHVTSRKQTVKIDSIGFNNYRTTLYPAHDNTYLLHEVEQIYKNKTKHFHCDGAILNSLENKADTIHMITDDTVGFVQYIKGQKSYIITLWFLKNNQTVKCKYEQFNFDGDAQSIVFSDTKLMCLVEKSIIFGERKIQVKLSYFQFPITENSKPINVTIALFQQMENFIVFAKKLNNQSGLVWIRKNSDYNYYDFYIYDIRDTSNQVKWFLFDPFRNKPEVSQFHIKDVWEPDHGKIYVKCEDTNGKIYQFIWDYLQDYIYVPKFYKQADHYVQFITGLREISKIPLNWDITAHPAYGTPPIDFVDIYSEQIVAVKEKQSWNCKQCYPESSSQIYISYTGPSPAKQFQVTINKLRPIKFSIKMIAVYMLIEIIQDCDDDLLREVYTIIQEGKDQLVQ